MSDSSKWVCVTLPGGELAVELITGVLEDLNVAGVVIDETEIRAYFLRSKWIELAESRLTEFVTNLAAENLLEDNKIAVSAAEDGDWVAAWRNRLGPIRCGQNFVIVPPVIEYTPAENDVILAIEPRMAFGTGEHPTTRMALALLEGIAPGCKRALDLGCGNGVLALGALLVSDCTCEGIDNEEEAVEETEDNARKHDVGTRINVQLGDALKPEIDGNFDLILANILLNPLLEGLEIWTKYASSGTYLIMTGVLAEGESQRLEKHASTLNWKLDTSLVEGDWYCGRFILE